MYTACRDLDDALLTVYVTPDVTGEDLDRFDGDLTYMRGACGRFNLCFLCVGGADGGDGGDAWQSLLRPGRYGAHLARVAVLGHPGLAPSTRALDAVVHPSVRHFCPGSWPQVRAWLRPDATAPAPRSA